MAVIAAVTTISSTQAGYAASQDDVLAAEARALVKSFAGTLKHTLVKSIKSEGPVSAIGVCHIAAPEIAGEQSKASGWKVGRTSAKLRNSSNAPDEWEARVLAMFAQKKAAGEDLKTMQFYETVEVAGKKTFRYMKAIGVGKPCLTCHGAEIKPGVSAKLKALYPSDMATGFKLGDLRGAFTLSRPLN
jgi:hypothetical protein